MAVPRTLIEREDVTLASHVPAASVQLSDSVAFALGFEGIFNDKHVMCGIIGYVGKQQAAPILLDGLRRLEYRGYDSAGLAVLCNGALTIRKCTGKIDEGL